MQLVGKFPIGSQDKQDHDAELERSLANKVNPEHHYAVAEELLTRRQETFGA